jgi:hypothetical protein
MPWVLVFFVGSLTGSYVAPVTIPMASEKLCQVSLEKLKAMYKETQAANYAVAGACIQTK